MYSIKISIVLSNKRNNNNKKIHTNITKAKNKAKFRMKSNEGKPFLLLYYNLYNIYLDLKLL